MTRTDTNNTNDSVIESKTCSINIIFNVNFPAVEENNQQMSDNPKLILASTTTPSDITDKVKIYCYLF